MLAPDQIGIDEARRVIANRPTAGWGNLVDFYSEPGLEDVVLPVDIQLQPQVRTRWFALDLRIDLPGAELRDAALVDARIAPARVVVRRWGRDDRARATPCHSFTTGRGGRQTLWYGRCGLV